MEQIFELLNETLKTIKINTGNMEQKVNENFCTVTELADELVKREGISFRSAHQIVGSIVGDCFKSGLNAGDITSEMLDEKAVEYISKKLNWSQEDIKNVLDGKNSISKKNSTGAPSPKETTKLIKKLNIQLEKDIMSYQTKVNKLIEADKKLNSEINKIF